MRGSGWSVPRSCASWPSASSSARIRSRNLTPRWSKATATFIGPLRYPHERGRALARAGTAAPRRFDPRRRRHEVRPPDVVHVRGRPDGGAPLEVPPLRLRRARRPAQRPPRVLERPRLAAAVLDVPRGRRDLGGGAALVPYLRFAHAGPPDPGDPVGRRGDGLARPGPALRLRNRARR